MEETPGTPSGLVFGTEDVMDGCCRGCVALVAELGPTTHTHAGNAVCVDQSRVRCVSGRGRDLRLDRTIYFTINMEILVFDLE
jgi:hypothetical protein